MNIWNGLSRIRKDLQSTAAPKFEDYIAIVEQVQETQRFLLNLAQNTTIMPDLSGKLLEADTKISELNVKIAELSAPDDLKVAFAELESYVLAGDKSEAVKRLENFAELQARKTTEVQLFAERMFAENKESVRAANNIARLANDKLRTDVENRLGKIETEIARLNRLLTIRTELDAINKA